MPDQNVFLSNMSYNSFCMNVFPFSNENIWKLRRFFQFLENECFYPSSSLNSCSLISTIHSATARIKRLCLHPVGVSMFAFCVGQVCLWSQSRFSWLCVEEALGFDNVSIFLHKVLSAGHKGNSTDERRPPVRTTSQRSVLSTGHVNFSVSSAVFDIHKIKPINSSQSGFSWYWLQRATVCIVVWLPFRIFRTNTRWDVSNQFSVPCTWKLWMCLGAEALTTLNIGNGRRRVEDGAVDAHLFCLT